jgi:hypothetical protein
MYKGVVPFIGLQLLGLAIVGFNPGLVNYLPTKTFLSSETAPPPKNPRLQLCLESHLFDFYDANKREYLSQVSLLNNIDYSALPKTTRVGLESSLKSAGNIFVLIDEIKEARAEMALASIAYAPIHTEVRSLERTIKQNKAEIKTLKNELRGTDDVSKKTRIKQSISTLEANIAEKLTLIPGSWQKTNKDFKLITTKLNRARMQFRRQSDQAYSEIRGIVKSINSVSILDDVRQDVVNVRARLDQQSVDEALSEIKTAYSALTKIPGANNAVKSLSNARRLIDRKDPNLPKAVAFVDETLASINAELTWRGEAKMGPYEKLAAFEAYARSNLGLREQGRLNPEQVDSITSCLARHRSLALQF